MINNLILFTPKLPESAIRTPQQFRKIKMFIKKLKTVCENAKCSPTKN